MKIEYLFARATRILSDPRLASRLSFLAVAVFTPAVALAFPGEQFALWARSYIVAPLCFFAIVTSILVACFRPQLAIGAVFVTIASLFVMWVMSNGAAVTSQLQGSN